MDMPPQTYLTVAEVARAIDRAPRTAWRRIQKAGIPRYRDPATGQTVIHRFDVRFLVAPVPIDDRDAA